MKKLIALLIFAGFTSAAFAKSGSVDENKNRSNGDIYQLSQNTGLTCEVSHMEKDYAYNQSGYIRGGEYDGYSRYGYWHRYHRHHHRHRYERRWHHRDYYY
jgi:hypothetical protein